MIRGLHVSSSASAHAHTAHIHSSPLGAREGALPIVRVDLHERHVGIVQHVAHAINVTIKNFNIII